MPIKNKRSAELDAGKLTAQKLGHLEEASILKNSSSKVEILKFELMKNIDLFQSFDEELLRKICQESKDIVLKKGEVLFEEGNYGIKLYIILSGQLLVYKKSKFINYLGPGQFIGEMALIDSKTRSASVKGHSPECMLLEIDKKQFVEFLCTNPDSLMEMLKGMSNRIRHDLDSMSREMEKLTILTHDIRNCIVPLQAGEIYLQDIEVAMCGTSDGHKKRKGWEKVQKSFQVLLSARNNVVTLIDQSLGLVKKVYRKYEKGKTCIKSLVENTIEEVGFHKFLKGKTVNLEVDGKAPMDMVCINSLDIKRVLQNLLINAGYATPKNGKIKVLILDLDEKIKITIEDYGEGIPEDIKPLLLNESLTTKPDGNGYGLLSCRDIIQEHHDGKIWFESQVGKGTKFHFIIPRG